MNITNADERMHKNLTEMKHIKKMLWNDEMYYDHMERIVDLNKTLSESVHDNSNAIIETLNMLRELTVKVRELSEELEDLKKNLYL